MGKQELERKIANQGQQIQSLKDELQQTKLDLIGVKGDLKDKIMDNSFKNIILT